MSTWLIIVATSHKELAASGAVKICLYHRASFYPARPFTIRLYTMADTRRVIPLSTPTTAPARTSDRVTSIEALRNPAQLGIFCRRANAASCVITLNYLFENEADAEAGDLIPPLNTVPEESRPSRQYYDTLFPTAQYPDNWKAKPGNMVVMEVLGTFILGNFTRNENETDAQYYLRAASRPHLRIFQQRFPLPPAFDYDNVTPGMTTLT